MKGTKIILALLTEFFASSYIVISVVCFVCGCGGQGRAIAQMLCVLRFYESAANLWLKKRKKKRKKKRVINNIIETKQKSISAFLKRKHAIASS